MAALKPKGERREYDVYETPEWCVKALLKIIPINKDWTYVEPCRASGRIYNHLPIGTAWGEIREGVNYLTEDYPHVDCCITNPPYSEAQAFVEKARGHSDVVIMLLRGGFLGSYTRHDWWKINKPTSLLVFSDRPSFTDDGKTDGSEYFWYVWDPKNRLGLDPFYFLSAEDGGWNKPRDRGKGKNKK